MIASVGVLAVYASQIVIVRGACVLNTILIRNC